MTRTAFYYSSGSSVVLTLHCIHVTQGFLYLRVPVFNMCVFGVVPNCVHIMWERCGCNLTYSVYVACNVTEDVQYTFIEYYYAESTYIGIVTYSLYMVIIYTPICVVVHTTHGHYIYACTYDIMHVHNVMRYQTTVLFFFVSLYTHMFKYSSGKVFSMHVHTMFTPCMRTR